jgi:hypothetical protein
MARLRAVTTTPDINALREALEQAWSADTSFDPSRWSGENPAWGQCAVTALIIQDHFGGELLHAEIGGISHFWNRMPTGQELDFTRHQFGATPTKPLEADIESRDYVLSFPDTRARYRRLVALTREQLALRSASPSR